MDNWFLLVCEGPNDEAVGSALVERFVSQRGETWDWLASAGYDKAWLYWSRWKQKWNKDPKSMRGTLSIPDAIKRLKKHRGEAVMALKVAHLAQRSAPSARVVFLRDTDGKVQREAAWQAFRQVRKEVLVGLAKNSIEAWILACWQTDDDEMLLALDWAKQNRASFDPFWEPDRLAPGLSKSLLETLGCVTSKEDVLLICHVADARFCAEGAQRVGLQDFVGQLQALFLNNEYT